MSDRITLTLRTPLASTIEVAGLTADHLAALDERVIASLPVRAGRQRAQLGDFFDVRGGRASTVHLAGDLSLVDGIAERMAGGELVVEGPVGRRVAAAMTAGLVRVAGNAGDDAGASMAGGLLRIAGSAGDRVGAASPGASKGMTGGEIIIRDRVGADAAARLRRGLVVVCGDTGLTPGREMIAGTLIVFGRTGAHPGRGNKRGSIVSVGEIEIPSTYRYACTYRPPHLRLTMVYLQRSHAIPIPEAVVSALYRRYCGDVGDPGKGEILARAGE